MVSEKDFSGEIYLESNLQYQSVVFLQDISGLRSSQRRSDPFAKCGGLLDQLATDIYVRKKLSFSVSPSLLRLFVGFLDLIFKFVYIFLSDF